jgi:hypothetical protein
MNADYADLDSNYVKRLIDRWSKDLYYRCDKCKRNLHSSAYSSYMFDGMCNECKKLQQRKNRLKEIEDND